MPTTRTLTLTNTLSNADLTPQVGVLITVSLLTPTALAGVDLDNVTIFNGALSQVTALTDSTGAYSVTAAYPGDITPTGCALLVNEGGQLTISPLGFSYTASIVVSTWYPVGAVSGSLKMLGTLGKVDTSALQGSGVSIALASRVTAPDGLTVLPAGQGVSLTSDSSGHFAVYAYPTVNCTPNNVPLIATYVDGSTETFTVPVNPTGWQGAYNASTTYHKNAGTLASPSDVVSEAGVYYQYINATPAAGHDPATSPTYWQVWAGEPIEWHITASSPPSVVVATTAMIPHDSNLPPIPGDPIQSPATLADDDANLASRTKSAYLVNSAGELYAAANFW